MFDRAPELDLMLKREFRILERLRHPGLVRLYELARDDEGLFFTMEALEGRDLYTAYRSGEPRPSQEDDGPTEEWGHSGSRAANPRRAVPYVELDTLRAYVTSLLDALAYLHDNGVIHRDLKPTNVLVTTNGVVKVLDFGIAVESSLARGGEPGRRAGTPGFAPPEQVLRGEASPASDLYSLGALLYGLVVGRPPLHPAWESPAWPPRIAEVVPEVPRTLDSLCADLLAVDPARRPTIEDVRRALHGAEPPSRRHLPAPKRVPLLEREGLLTAMSARMGAAAAGGFVAVALHGRSGVGKTAVLDAIAQQQPDVLRVSVRPREHIAFNAVDGIVDGVARLLRAGSPALLRDDVRPSAEIAACLFPVLRSVVDEAAPSSRRAPSRLEATEALLTLLAAVASARGGLVVLVDDVQWADQDSRTLLEALLARRPPHVALVLAVRDDVSDAAKWLAGIPSMVHEQVGPLSSEAMSRLLSQALSERDARPERLGAFLDACAGRPIVAQLLASHLPREKGEVAVDLELALETAVTKPSLLRRELLALLSAASGWLTYEELARSLGTSFGVVDNVLRDLEAEHLVRIGLRRHGLLEARIDHDLIDDAVQRALDGTELRAAHAALAAALEVDPSVPRHRIVGHLVSAGDGTRAAALARIAATEALGIRAYAMASEMLAIALRDASGEEATRLRAARADALESYGQHEAAAVEWSLVAEGVGEAAEPARYRQIAALLTAWQPDAALRALEGTGSRFLRVEPSSPMTKVVLFARLAAGTKLGIRAARLLAWASRGRKAPAVTRHLQLRVAYRLAYLRPLDSIRMYLDLREDALAHEDQAIAAQTELSLAYILMLGAGRAGPVPLAERYRVLAASRMRDDADLVWRAYAGVVDGFARVRLGHFREALRLALASVALLRDAGLVGSWEHLFTLKHAIYAARYAQDWKAHEALFAEMESAQMNFRDALTEYHLLSATSEALAARGYTRAALDAIERGLVVDGYPADHLHAWRAILRLRAGLGETPEGLAATLQAGRAAGVLGDVTTGAMAAGASLAEVTAMRRGDRGARRRRVQRYARISLAAPPLGNNGALRALAYLADAEDRPDLALSWLRRAEAHARRWSQATDLAVISYQLGRRIGGDEGRSLREGAEVAAAEQGVARDLVHEDPGDV